MTQVLLFPQIWDVESVGMAIHPNVQVNFTNRPKIHVCNICLLLLLLCSLLLHLFVMYVQVAAKNRNNPTREAKSTTCLFRVNYQWEIVLHYHHNLVNELCDVTDVPK